MGGMGWGVSGERRVWEEGEVVWVWARISDTYTLHPDRTRTECTTHRREGEKERERQRERKKERERERERDRQRIESKRERERYTQRETEKQIETHRGIIQRLGGSGVPRFFC